MSTLITPRQEWEMALASARHSVSLLSDLLKSGTLYFNDSQEMYKEIDELLITTNYIQHLTNEHQYLCAEDVQAELADAQDHEEYDDWH